jgi:hypothetical protein
MAIVMPRGDVDPVVLQEPNGAGYVLLAATVDGGPPVVPNSRRKRALLDEIRADVRALRRSPDVVEADLFDAVLVAPGMGRELLRRRAATVTPARFDVVVLVRTTDPQSAVALRADSGYRHLVARMSAAATRTYEIAARNVRRIADVDHGRPSVFLFNFFYADDPERLVPVWHYTARWFVDHTALPDSTVLEPLAGEPADYGIINHASWPNFRTFLPQLALRPSFRRFVLTTFAANSVAAQPILYRRVPN